MRRLKITLAGGLALMALAIVLTLLHSPLSVSRRNAAHVTERIIAQATQAGSFCQPHELLPRHTTAIRPWLISYSGPPLEVKVFSHGRLVTSGAHDSEWIGWSVTVGLRPLAHAVTDATVCVSFPAHPEGVEVPATSPSVGAHTLQSGTPIPGKMMIEYLQPGNRSWASQLRSIARRMELGRTTTGAWIVLLAFLLLAAAIALALRLLLTGPERPSTFESPHTATQPRARRLPDVLRRVPAAAWVCALVACLNAAGWSIVMPAFEVVDEPYHFAYVKQLADTGTPPSTAPGLLAQELNAAMEATWFYEVRFRPTHAISTRVQQSALEASTHATIGESEGSPHAGDASSQPPLYYALEAIPYSLARDRPIPDRLALMRLLSALLAGVTALFAFLFVREALPREPWAWAVGGLGVALAPLLGVVSGSVNPDSLLFAVSAALFYCLARGFRRGLTTRMAIAIGLVTAIGLVSKLNFLGLLPGVLLGVGVLSLRAARRESRRAAVKALALAVGIGLSPAFALLAIDAVAHKPLLGPLAESTGTAKGSPLGQLSYIWQFYLPRLPGMVNDFPGVSTWRQLWFNGYVGLYGWRDTVFPSWVYTVALLPAAAIVLLCMRTLTAYRATVSRRAGELAVYVAVTLGVMGIVGAASYSAFPAFEAEYLEVRYLFPLLALLAGVLTLAARGAGRRWGPAVGALIVVLFVAHDIFSQLLVVARYYG